MMAKAMEPVYIFSLRVIFFKTKVEERKLMAKAMESVNIFSLQVLFPLSGYFFSKTKVEGLRK
jgi:hypothetical protein